MMIIYSLDVYTAEQLIYEEMMSRCLDCSLDVYTAEQQIDWCQDFVLKSVDFSTLIIKWKLPCSWQGACLAGESKSPNLSHLLTVFLNVLVSSHDLILWFAHVGQGCLTCVQGKPNTHAKWLRMTTLMASGGCSPKLSSALAGSSLLLSAWGASF